VPRFVLSLFLALLFFPLPSHLIWGEGGPRLLKFAAFLVFRVPIQLGCVLGPLPPRDPTLIARNQSFRSFAAGPSVLVTIATADNCHPPHKYLPSPLSRNPSQSLQITLPALPPTDLIA
jgi:hypothetical protein